MEIMSCRYINLLKCLDGYKRTGTHLIEWDGTKLLPSFTADDLGIYIFIPKIATFFNLSLDHAISIFFYGIAYGALIIGLIGCLFLYKSWLERFIAWSGLVLITKLAVAIGDVYIAYAACASALIPWSLYSINKKWSFSYYSFTLLAGIIIGFSNYIRAHAGTGVLLILITLIATNKKNNVYQRSTLLAIFFIGLSLPALYANTIYKTYRHYSETHLKDYQQGAEQHVFWHNIYIGFGFLNFMNTEGITYDDRCADNKVTAVARGVTIADNDSYETTLKNEIIKLIKNNIMFVIFTIFAKLGVLLFYLLKYANVGLILSLYYRKPFVIECSLLIGLIFYALFPLLTIPSPQYALGFITFTTLYGIISINNALQQGLLQHLHKAIRYAYQRTLLAIK